MWPDLDSMAGRGRNGVPSAGEEETAGDGDRPRRLRQLQASDGRVAGRAEGQGAERESSQAKASEAESGLISEHEIFAFATEHLKRGEKAARRACDELVAKGILETVYRGVQRCYRVVVPFARAHIS
jgi:hypothetical protein